MTEDDLFPIDGSRQPVVFTRDGEVFANSRDVAAYFGKNHRDVLVAIDNLLKSLAAEKSAAENRAFTLIPFVDETRPGRRAQSWAQTPGNGLIRGGTGRLTTPSKGPINQD